MTKTNVALTTIAIAAAVAVPFILEHKAQARLQQQVRLLQEQLGETNRLKVENDILPNLIVQAQTSTVETNAHELLRLRGEVGLLRQGVAETEALKQENRQLRTVAENAQQQAAKAALHPLRTDGFIPREQWKFAGLANPEAALQSAFWAMQQQDPTSVWKTLVPSLRDQLIKEFPDRTEDQLMAHLKKEVENMDGHYVYAQKNLSEDEVVLSVDMTGSKEAVRQILLKRVGDEWKFAGPYKDRPY